MQNEKRQLAENDRDRLAKQMELFKDILNGHKNYASVSDEERRHLLSSCNLQNIVASPSRNIFHHQPPIPPTFTLNRQEFITEEPAPTNVEDNNRRSLSNIDDTGFIISDYTADDIELPDEDEPNTAYLFTNAKDERRCEQENKAPAGPSRARSSEKGRESESKKRSKHQSTSLTRSEQRAQKRSRTRSTEVSLFFVYLYFLRI